MRHYYIFQYIYDNITPIKGNLLTFLFFDQIECHKSWIYRVKHGKQGKINGKKNCILQPKVSHNI